MDDVELNVTHSILPNHRRFRPVWERGLTPTLSRATQPRWDLGANVMVTQPPRRPPPPLAPLVDPMFDDAPTAPGGMPKRRRIQWPKAPRTDNAALAEKAAEVRR